MQQKYNLKKFKIEDFQRGRGRPGKDRIKIYILLTWHDGGAHLLAAPGQGERDQCAVEQRLGQVRVQVRHGRCKRRDVVRQPMVGVFDATVHVADPIVSLVLEVQTVCVVDQSRSKCEQQIHC